MSAASVPHSDATLSYLKRLLAQADAAVASHSTPAHSAALIRRQLEIITQTAQRQQEEQQQIARRHMEEMAYAQLHQSRVLQQTVRDLHVAGVASPLPAPPAHIVAAPPAASPAAATPAAIVMPDVSPALVVRRAAESSPLPLLPKRARREAMLRPEAAVGCIAPQPIVTPAHIANHVHEIAPAVVIVQAPIAVVTQPIVPQSLSSEPTRDPTGAPAPHHPEAIGDSHHAQAVTSSASHHDSYAPLSVLSPLTADFTTTSDLPHIPLSGIGITPTAAAAAVEITSPATIDHPPNNGIHTLPAACITDEFIAFPADSPDSTAMPDWAAYRDYDPIRSSHSPQLGAHDDIGVDIEHEIALGALPADDLFYDMIGPVSTSMSPSTMMFMSGHEELIDTTPAADGQATTPHLIDASPTPSSPADTVASASLASDRSSATSRLSRSYLAAYLEDRVLAKVESKYNTGEFSAIAVRQYVMWIACTLEAEEQAQLLDQFTNLNLTGCEEALLSCTHVDVHPAAGLPCCPRKASPHWGGGRFAELSLQEDAESISSAAVPMIQPELSPDQELPDDPDGVARVRITFLYHTSTKKRRRRHSSSPSDSSDSSDSDLTSLDADSEPTAPVQRVVAINKSYARLHGYSQADIKKYFSLAHPQPTMAYTFRMRSDHHVAAMKIAARCKMQHVEEIHMFQVRHIENGSDVYCLIHLQCHRDRGMLLGIVESVMPLPDDPDHPPPPFVEGVDLDEETLLYGYKPPTAVDSRPHIPHETDQSQLVRV